jgi:acetoacetate decarboxylase
LDWGNGKEAEMGYPPAPWALEGCGVQTLQLVDSGRARTFVPSELDIVSVLPGRTLGGVYLAAYGPGSVLAYSELIAAAALARCSGRWGFWISHIYVDDADSMAGGREIWGLPKELAQFTWDGGEKGQVTVRQGDRSLCTLSWGRRRWLWRQRFPIPTLSVLGSNLLHFKGQVRTRLGIASGNLQVSEESPFAELGLGRAKLIFHYGEMTFVANRPQVIGQP